MNANGTQVGGDHYRKLRYQWWDFAIDTGLGPLEFGLGKYATRYRDKGGIEDLRKAIHFVDKMAEAYDKDIYPSMASRTSVGPGTQVDEFVELNGHGEGVRLILAHLTTWGGKTALGLIRVELERMLSSWEQLMRPADPFLAPGEHPRS